MRMPTPKISGVEPDKEEILPTKWLCFFQSFCQKISGTEPTWLFRWAKRQRLGAILSRTDQVLPLRTTSKPSLFWVWQYGHTASPTTKLGRVSAARRSLMVSGIGLSFESGQLMAHTQVLRHSRQVDQSRLNRHNTWAAPFIAPSSRTFLPRQHKQTELHRVPREGSPLPPLSPALYLTSKAESRKCKLTYNLSQHRLTLSGS